MKNKILMVLAFSLVLGGCSKKSDASLTRIRLGTGGTSGTYYTYGEAMGHIIQSTLNLPVTVLSTGASRANIELVQGEQAEFALVQNDVMTYAYNGTNLFSTDGAFKNFSAVAALYPEACQVVATPDLGDIGDLRGKRVSLGDQGSGTEFNAQQILESFGLSIADIKPQYLGFSASVDALKAGQIDAFFCTAGAPTPAILDLASSTQVKLLPVGDAHARLLISAYPFYTQYTIPAGTYPGINEDVPMVAVVATLIVGNKVGESAVYQLIKTLFENQPELARAHGKGRDLTLKNAVEGIPVPFHPGAVKYFKEKGAIP
ncbi:MAG: TAXI family TRAP transporter solute-binding subunit [Treponema sp.]|nr:TAXI family TRAP transporter solute-binding subunit [Treponema sp.]